VFPLDALPGYRVEMESPWLLVVLDYQCICWQALWHLESIDSVESTELVVSDYFEVDLELVGKIRVELEPDFWRWYIWMTAVVVHNYA